VTVDAAPAPPQLALHVPSPPAQQAQWRDAVLAGTPLADVVVGDDSVAAWLWRRWRTLERVGIDRAGFDRIVLAYRREIWLWLEGDRQWEQCCAGLIGRLGRRIPA
jgi:hypothetical protein